jgi:5'/3'-nucleotidase SurE
MTGSHRLQKGVSLRIARIVISNDDGLTSNILALYNALKAAGHDVIVSVPCQNQSGTGTSLNQGLPAPTLAQACRCGSAAAGAPSAGPMQREGIGAGDFFYVEGTPVMAVLYGIDVLAQGRWGKPPDLVLSGPNEGQNVGSIIVNSGTVSVVQMALARGIAAIALSAGANSADDATLANPLSKLIATLSVQLVRSLLAHAGQGKILPAGLGLNVNFPDNPEGAAWKAAVVGSYSAYDFVFVPDIGCLQDRCRQGRRYCRPGGSSKAACRSGPSACRNGLSPKPSDQKVGWNSMITAPPSARAAKMRLASLDRGGLVADGDGLLRIARIPGGKSEAISARPPTISAACMTRATPSSRASHRASA